MASGSTTISEIGEKRLIAEFIRPFFNRNNRPGGVGDDCAMIDLGDETFLLASTDRVPANLIAFKLGILDYRRLGRYLACLNLSDIAACGGTAQGMLLNMGLPRDLLHSQFTDICAGFGELAATYNCPVLGGDITESFELSISATAIGRVRKDHVLTRRMAAAGDSVFVSRPLGLTPAAFAFYTSRPSIELDEDETKTLAQQFTALTPMIDLGTKLGERSICTSCMDNTDGVGQSFAELAEQSGVALIIEEASLCVPSLVRKIAESVGKDARMLALAAGADFSLVGTLRGDWTTESASRLFGLPLWIVGRVEVGTGVLIEEAGSNRRRFVTEGWNYFAGVDPLPPS